jgi:hypothetical protein
VGESAVGPLATFRTGEHRDTLDCAAVGRSRRNRRCRGMLPLYCPSLRAALCAARTVAGERYTDSNGA